METNTKEQARDNSDLLAQIEALKAENARLQATKAAGKLTLKVSDKGAVSIYGLGKWPVTLYETQMRRLLGHSVEILAFMDINKDKLATKA